MPVALAVLLSTSSSWAVDSELNSRERPLADSTDRDTAGPEPDRSVTSFRAGESQAITVSQASAKQQIGTDVDIVNVHKVLGTFTTKQKIFRKYVLIESDLSDDQIVDIALQLHMLEPETWFYMMDSDSEFDQMLAALSETENGNLENWPSDYVEAHFVARTLEEIRTDGDGDTIRAWVVEGGPSRTALVADI